MVLTVFFLIWGLANKNIQYPFETKNMYIWEMVNIGIGSVFLSLQPNDEQIKSSFMTNILSRVLPAALFQIIVISFFYFIAYVFGGNFINVSDVKDLSVLFFSIGSFIVLIRICMPFDAYRAMLVVGLGFIDMIAIFSDYNYCVSSGLSSGIFGINYNVIKGGLSNKTSFVLILSVVIGVLLYIVLEILAGKIHVAIDKKKEESKYENV